MCRNCDKMVASTGEYMDRLMEAERKRRNTVDASRTSAEQTVDLANIVLATYATHPNETVSLMNLALGFAVCMTRLIAIEDIYGVSSK